MPANDTPNILWIMTDQQPVGTVGAFGNPTIKTPHIDRMAHEGVRFDQAFIAAYPCGPSRASLLTGLYAHNHGAVTNEVLLDEALPSLGNLCAETGYQTAYLGKWHLGGLMTRHGDGWYSRRIPNDEQFTFEPVDGGTGEDESCTGFSEWIGGWRHYRDYLRQVGFGKQVDEHRALGQHNALPSGPDSEHSFSLIPQEHHVEAFIADQAERYIRAAADSGRQPFAAVVSFYGPHLPVTPPRPWDELYAMADVPVPFGIDEDLTAKPANQAEARSRFADGWTTEQYIDYVRRYWGFVSYIDEQIGRVLRALDETGQAENTIVVFASDHGDMIGEHGLIYKLTGAVYDTLMRTPLIVRYPKHLAAGGVCSQLISSIDILPTVLDLAGIEVPSGLDGRSFMPSIRDPKQVHRPRVFTDVMNKGLIVFDGRWKYGFHWALDNAQELYDLHDDPHEQHNRAHDATCASIVKDLRAHLIHWLRTTGHPYAEPISQRILAPTSG
jgi:arylsulfatase